MRRITQFANIVNRKLEGDQDAINLIFESIKTNTLVLDNETKKLIRKAIRAYQFGAIGDPYFAMRLFYLLQTNINVKFKHLNILSYGIMGECSMDKIILAGLQTPRNGANTKTIRGHMDNIRNVILR